MPASAARGRRPLRQRTGPTAGGEGLTLLELLLALAVGLALFVTLLQALLLHGRGNERLVRLVRERGVQRRTLALLRSELLRAEQLELGAHSALAPSCSLAGRRPVLQLRSPEGTITYSIGAPPSAIWRGQVLMRCGPAYGLDGEPSPGASQNRVLLDALTTAGFTASRSGPGRLRLQLLQQFALLEGGGQTIISSLEVATAQAGP